MSFSCQEVLGIGQIVDLSVLLTVRAVVALESPRAALSCFCCAKTYVN